MRRLLGIPLILLSLSVVVPLVAHGKVFINEIAWMGTQADYRDEWVEISSDEAVTLDGWTLIIAGKKDIPLTGQLSAGGFFVVRRPDETNPSSIPTDLFASFGSGLSNTGDTLILKDGSGREIDRANGADAWKINGSSDGVGNNDTKETAQYNGAIWITAVATPKAANKRQSQVPPPPPQTPTPPSSTPPASAPQTAPAAALPMFNVSAGDDRTVPIGSAVPFFGVAVGVKAQPLEGARFWWNFGDGETAEGKNVAHIFRNTGTYLVGLHVSSAERTVSDYATIRVAPNQLNISRVISGGTGSIHLISGSQLEIDIGGWSIEDGTSVRFFFPPGTKIGPAAESAFANAVTSLGRSHFIFPVIMRYPNGDAAFEYAGNEEGDILEKEVRSPAVTVSVPPLPVPPPPKTQAVARQVTISQPVVEDSVVPSASEMPLTNASLVRAAESSSRDSDTPLFFLGAVGISLVAAIGFLIIKAFR